MDKRKLKDIFECNYIEDKEKLYPLQKWYNQLLDKSISDINVTDVIKMIRQNEFVDIAIPKAISFLKSNPLVGDMYEGELLEKICGLDNSQIIYFLDDLDIILCLASKENETYEWLLEDEREEYQKLIHSLSEKIKDLRENF